MSGIHVYTSNHMEILAKHLAHVVRAPLDAPLTPETIVVQSSGMERWISLELARINGVCANCSFPFPNAFLENIFTKLMPNLPEVLPFDRKIMTFRLMKIIPGYLNLAGFNDLKSYLSEDVAQLRLFQLSTKIADLFDQYLVFRPQLIFQWEEAKEEKRQPDIWQAKLWRELIRGKEGLHRARLHQKLIKKINNLSSDTTDLPKRVSIYGISYLPLSYMQIFAELSKLIEINFFLLNPCREYWADILSEKEIKKIRSKDPRVSENIEWYHLSKGNRLLSSLGTLGRNFFEVIAELDCEFHESYEEPVEQSILACIQSDILLLRDREKTATKGSTSEELEKILTSGSGVEAIRFSEQDTSIQVHSCHSPMREIEVLHDNLLDMFEEDPELLPKDIIVMAPDIEAYAPYIHAVFDAQTDNALRIPFSVADQSSRKQNRMIDGFFTLIELADSRFEADKILELLSFRGIKERFGLVEADIKTIEYWIEDTNVRWGMDADSRVQHGLPGFSENTWQAGLDRLLLGYAMTGDNKDMFHGILPFDNIEGSVAQVFGRFLEFIDRLFASTKTLLIPRKLGDWQQILLNLVDLFFLPDESGERELQLLRNLLGEFADKEKYSEFEERVELEVIRSYLHSQLQEKSYGTGFLTGGVTFCAMLPMRSIPFKVMCLIGMNHDAFPRDFQPLNFDLITRYPKLGDRSRRNDDKYLFLESILSARKRLYISYVGQDIQDNSPIPPSVLVSELLDTIENSFEYPGKRIQEYIVKTHRLQPFSPWYFRSGTGLFSYSTENMLASTGAIESKTPRPFIEGRIPMTSEEAENWQKLEIDSVCKFFSNPAKFFCSKAFGNKLGRKEAAVESSRKF